MAYSKPQQSTEQNSIFERTGGPAIVIGRGQGPERTGKTAILARPYPPERTNDGAPKEEALCCFPTKRLLKTLSCFNFDRQEQEPPQSGQGPLSARCPEPVCCSRNRSITPPVAGQLQGAESGPDPRGLPPHRDRQGQKRIIRTELRDFSLGRKKAAGGDNTVKP